MATYTITLSRTVDATDPAEAKFGIKSVSFDVGEGMYAMVGDILTGKLRVEPPKEEAPVEDAPSEAE